MGSGAAYFGRQDGLAEGRAERDRLRAECDRYRDVLQHIACLTGATRKQVAWAQEAAERGDWDDAEHALESLWGCADDYYSHREQMRRLAREALDEAV